MSLLQPSATLDNASALHISQQAPRILSQSSPSTSQFPFNLLSSESPETWTIYENLLLSCLRTRDDVSARQCLDRLIARFGEDNAHIKGLRGVYNEATARHDGDLEKILKEYAAALRTDPSDTPIAKRRVALLRSLGRPTEAIAALVELLDSSPADAEAWLELADLYQAQSMFSQAVYSLEEVLLITPNAWNVHARLGEVTYLSALASSNSAETPAESERPGLTSATRSFSRSIELCDDYLRGYYGLKLSTTRLLRIETDAASGLSRRETEALNGLATAKLAEIVRRSSAGEKGWKGYSKAEVIAARELLDRDSQHQR